VGSVALVQQSELLRGRYVIEVSGMTMNPDPASPPSLVTTAFASVALRTGASIGSMESVAAAEITSGTEEFSFFDMPFRYPAFSAESDRRNSEARGPLGVNRLVSAMSAVSPLYPQEPTSSVIAATSEKCQIRLGQCGLLTKSGSPGGGESTGLQFVSFCIRYVS
jgi:hypothetical protein